MKNTIKTSQSKDMPLSPVGNENPTPTTVVASNGENREIDTGAKAIDDRTHHEIFDDLLVKGELDSCENPNQINKKIAEAKGDGKVSTYFVNARSHGWARVNGKWVKPTEEWLAANPYTPGTRTAKAGGMLADEEVASIKAQLTALELVPEAGKASVAPIVDGLQAKLAAHEKAVSEAAISREKIRNRTAACTAFEGILKLADKAGRDWENDVALALASMGAILKLDKVACLSCLASLVGADVAKEGTDLFKRFGHTF